jgi:HD-like signal output (HDOD) protein
MTDLIDQMTRPVEPGALIRRLKLPPLPGMARQMLTRLDDPFAQVQGVADLVAKDAALSAALLRLVNSPFFGMQRRIASVTEAVFIAGLATVQRIVLTASLARPFARGLPVSLARRFWSSSLRCAAAARRLGNDAAASALVRTGLASVDVQANDAEIEIAYTAGLLHNIGLLGMCIASPSGFAASLINVEKGASTQTLESLENLYFGFGHVELATAMLIDWRLPAGVIDAVSRQDDPVDPHACEPAATGLPTAASLAWRGKRIAALLEGRREHDDADGNGHLPTSARALLLGLPAGAVDEIEQEVRHLLALIEGPPT